MKIAVYHELPQGGARISVNEMAGFLKKKHKIDLFTIENNLTTYEKDFYTNIYRYTFEPKVWEGGNAKRRLYKDTIELIKLYFLNKKIAGNILKGGYDLLFVHASSRIEAPFILKFQNTKKVFYLHDPYFRQIYEPELHPLINLPIYKAVYEKLFRKVLRYLDQKNVRGVDYVLANSEFSKDLFRKAYNKGSTVSYLGVDTYFYKPLRNVKKQYDILFIGSKSDIDGYDTFQEILKILDKKIKVKAILAETEWVSSKEMKELYNSVRIVLCLSRKEPFGLVPLEAAACGTPVIAVNEGGYKETIIDTKTGYLVYRDPKKLKNKIAELLENTELQNKMKKIARENVVKKWNMQVRYDALEKILATISKTK